MKTTKLVLMAAACCFALTTNAQVTYGPVLGLNMATVGGDESSSNAMKMGFHIGGVVDIGVSDNFSVETGIQYSGKGTQDKDESSYKWNLAYIDIPVLAKYKMESGLNFFAGPYVGILMSSEVTDGTTDLDVKEFTSSTDFGMKLGLGFQMESGLALSAHYGLGLANLYKEGDDSNTNGVIGISVAYMLGGE